MHIEERKYRLEERTDDDKWGVLVGPLVKLLSVHLLDPLGVSGPVELQESVYAKWALFRNPYDKMVVIDIGDEYKGKEVLVKGRWGDSDGHASANE